MALTNQITTEIGTDALHTLSKLYHLQSDETLVVSIRNASGFLFEHIMLAMHYATCYNGSNESDTPEARRQALGFIEDVCFDLAGFFTEDNSQEDAAKRFVKILNKYAFIRGGYQ